MQATRSVRRVSVVTVTVLTSLAMASALAASPASAQGRAARDAAAARALFQEGVACADHRDWSCAADRFARAHEMRPSPVIAYNLGHALVEQGRLVEGAEMLRQALRDGSASAQVRADAGRMVEALTPRIGRLTLHVRGPVEGVTIRIGDVEVPEALHGTSAPIDPGPHAISAVRGGEIVASATVEVAEGASVEAELTIPEAPVVDTSVAPEPEEARAEDDAERMIATPVAPPPSGSDEGLWIGLGVGAGVLVVGAAVVLGVVLAQPQEPSPFGGNLGTVDVGR